VVCLLASPPSVTAGTHRHLVVHGGFSKADLAEIARNVHTLIVSNYRLSDLQTLKRHNPDLVLLRYHHALGARPNTPDWADLQEDESVFMHDAASGRRLVAEKYGWRLLNIGSARWRRLLCNRVRRDTEPIFDGVFIDDFWIRYVDKFTAEGLHRPGRPADDVIEAWQAHMTAGLQALRAVYPGQVFINGAHREYLEWVDGCMDEGFVHGNWESDTSLPTPAEYYRSLLRIERLKAAGKILLVQSGTRGDAPANIERLYRLCAASYFLVAGPDTSFGFHPLGTYDFRKFPVYDDYHLDLGAPRSNFYAVKTTPAPANRIPNGDFSRGLQDWQIISGRPAAVEADGAEGPAVVFHSRAGGSDRIMSGWIPVDGDAAYRLFTRVRSESNRAGSARYKKLGLQGRFYDSRKQKLPGAFDLQFDPGTYDWRPFEITHTSPSRAAFFRVRLGFIADGSGKGWIDAVRLTPAVVSGALLRRDFEKGAAMVNSGLPEIPVRPPPDTGAGAHDQAMRSLKPLEGRIMLFE
jgi:hypothetical protein